MQGSDGRGRSIVLTGACLFVVSTVFPIAASLLAEEQVGRLMGGADVAIAAALLGCAASITRRASGVDSSGLVRTIAGFQQHLWSVPLALLVLFFLEGDRVRWKILLPGLAWRLWLLAYVFPSALGVWKSGRPGAQVGMRT